MLVPPGASPATYEPKPSQMAALAKAKALFTIGVPFEGAWLPRLRAAAPDLRVIATDAGISKQPIGDHQEAEEDGGHQDRQEHQGHSGHEGQEGHHRHHRGLDPHIWLSPPLVKKQVVTIAAALEQMLPDEADKIAANRDSFLSAIDELDSELHTILAGRQGMTFMVFHPSWGYFATEYGLHQQAVEIEGKAPKPAQLAAFIEKAKAMGIRTIFVQPQFSTRAAEVVAAETGAVVTVADPLAEQWAANLRRVARLLAGEAAGKRP